MYNEIKELEDMIYSIILPNDLHYFNIDKPIPYFMGSCSCNSRCGCDTYCICNSRCSCNTRRVFS